MSDKNIVIFDLDGTLALIDHRRHYVQKKKATKEDWRNFYAACVDDLPNEAVITMCQALYLERYIILIFSGRSREVELQTVEWLRKHDIQYNMIYMRQEGDYTPDEQLKQQWLAQLPRERILCVYDDRAKVVKMWREQGIPCFQVADGDF